MKNTIGQQLGRSLAELVTKVEEHNALGRLSARVPGRERPETAGNETGLGDTKQQTGGNEGAIAVLESLEGRDGAEEEELQGEPLAGADAVENHVGWDFEEHDAERQHLLTDVELILGDADILEEGVGDGVGDVSTIELQAEEAQGEQGHNDQIEPRWDGVSGRLSRCRRAGRWGAGEHAVVPKLTFSLLVPPPPWSSRR